MKLFINTALAMIWLAPQQQSSFAMARSHQNEFEDQVHQAFLRGDTGHADSADIEDSADSADIDVTHHPNRSNRPNRSDRTTQRNGPRRRNEWLSSHNLRREEYHEMIYNIDYVPLTWSPGLAAEAQAWAEYLSTTCKMELPSPNPYGINIAGKQDATEFRTTEEVMGIWENKYSQGWPNNKEMSQVLWSGTKYLGCADALTDAELAAETSMTPCTYSVCLYAERGNCGMNSYNDGSYEWWTVPIAEGRTCGDCPPEFEEGEDCD